MTRNREIEQRLQDLLRGRRVAVDENRLEAMRARLLPLVARTEAGPAPGFFHRYRFALSFGTALVLVGLLVWQFQPQRPSGPVLDSEIARILEDEDQFTDMLVVFHDFTAARAQDDFLADWILYNPAGLETGEGENLFETFYGWVTPPRNPEPSAWLPLPAWLA